jgi:hypothetical protein
LKLKGYNCQLFSVLLINLFPFPSEAVGDLLDTEALLRFPEEWIRRTAATAHLPNIMKIMKGFLNINVPRLYN